MLRQSDARTVAVGTPSAGGDPWSSKVGPDPQTSYQPQVRQAHAGGGWLSRYARGKKLEFFFARIPKDARILDFGCADGWVREWAVARGWHNLIGIDLQPPADIVGDIHEWRALGLEAHSFDVVVAFEVVEHGDFAKTLAELLKPDGMLVATTPVPRLDWVCKVLEAVRILQVRSGPHDYLVDLRRYPGFKAVWWKRRGLISQWGILQPS